MASKDIIVIGGSAGSIQVLSELAASLPKNLPASVFVVVHIAPEAHSLLPEILTTAGPLPASHAQDGQSIERGHIYVAPPDHHLLLEDGVMRTVRGPKENRHRPAVDPLFRSAAVQYGPRVAGVILSGALDDGSAGLLEIKRRGGAAVVQDPESAQHKGMPESALRTVKADYVVQPDALGGVLAQIAEGAKDRSEPALKPNGTAAAREAKIAEFDMPAIEAEDRPGHPSAFACPECHGVLWEIEDGPVLRYRCRVGHAMTAEYLAVEQREAIERALWVAMRAMEENASLHRQLGQRARDRDFYRTAAVHDEQAKEQEDSALLVRQILGKK